MKEVIKMLPKYRVPVDKKKHNNKKKLSRYHNAIARFTTNVLENY